MLDEYARTDVRITSKLAEIFLSDPALPGAELEIMAHTVRNFVDTPLEVDGAVVDHALCEFNGILEETTAKTKFSVEEYSGRKSFAEILGRTLEAHDMTLPTKSDKNGNPIPAVAKDDEKMQELLNDPVEEIRDIARAKMLVSAAPNIRSKLEFLKSRATLPGAKLYPELAYHRAQTGRFAGAGGFNIQNLGHAERSEHIPPEIVGAIAKSIKVPKGGVLVASDASQIEARILAFLSGEKELHNSFAKGNDVYSEFASATFGEKVEKTKGDTPEALRMKALRQVGKMAVLGLGYGMGAVTFEKNLRSEPSISSLFETGLLSADKCAGLVRGYRLKYPLVPAFWRESEKAFRMAVDGVGSSVSGVGFLKQDGNVVLRLPSGRSLIYEDARVEPSERGVVIVYGDDKKLYGGKIVENIVQAVARDILCRAILEIEKQGFKVVTHIHDSIICATKNEDAEACLKTMEDSWRNIPEWIAGLCLDAESKTGPSLADVI